MFRISVLLALAGCGGAEPATTTTPADDPTACPSETAPGRCQELAQTAATSGHGDLAWAYTVLECESKPGAHCVAMWQLHAKDAPTQTDALNVLHVACAHLPDACEQLAGWHTLRGHALVAAAYRRDAGNPSALATDLAAALHIADAPRTEAIAQMIGHEVPAPVAPPPMPAHAEPDRKALPMHAAAFRASTDGCASTAMRDRHAVPPSQCITEVRPLDGDQIALVNRCDQSIVVSFAGARADGSAFANQLQLERNEARSIGMSHHDLGPLNFAACPGECRITSGPGDSAAWTVHDASYACAKSGH